LALKASALRLVCRLDSDQAWAGVTVYDRC
jgi:hypothetical protein